MFVGTSATRDGPGCLSFSVPQVVRDEGCAFTTGVLRFAAAASAAGDRPGFTIRPRLAIVLFLAGAFALATEAFDPPAFGAAALGATTMFLGAALGLALEGS